MGSRQLSLGYWVVFSLMLCAFYGCAAAPATVGPHQMNSGGITVPEPKFPIPRPASEGSLWTDSAELLFVDKRARGVGDTVTVDIVENTSSSLDANTSASRSSSIDASINQFLGRPFTANGTNVGNKVAEASIANAFDGKGTSERSGQVTASIGARVVEVLANGNLAIYGRREMKVNNELQHITVSGIIRPKDIDSDNRIKSVYLSDSRIEYSGRGVLADKQRPGWGSRILDVIWPF